MEILRTPAAMRAWADAVHSRSQRLVLVPTMGFLHAGHLSLVQLARRHGEQVAASIFVNPTQFGPKEDLGRYPRDEAGDLQKLASAGADAVFIPTAEAMYPSGFDTYVVPENLANVLCGKSRPGHFRGVCTVVTLLFRISRCDAAVLGEKDYQQLTILRRMVKDLWLDVQVIGAPLVREADGLAMSSRNVYLSATERQAALALSRGLFAARERFGSGERRGAVLRQLVQAELERAPAVRIDYVELVDAERLTPVDDIRSPVVCAVAAFLGKTRLIDNVQLGNPTA